MKNPIDFTSRALFPQEEENPVERLVRLRTSSGDDREVTVYVKGFLTRGERADHFEAWSASHAALVSELGWGPRVYGYCWPSGRLPGPAMPLLTPLVAGWRVYSRARHLRRFAALGTVGWVAAEEAVYLAASFVQQYMAASKAAEQRANLLAARLRTLRSRYDYVRVVGHSLGCRHVLEAVTSLPSSRRPDEVHLCAPAFREKDVADKLPQLARVGSVLYHTPSDAVLELGFRMMSGGSPAGSKGLEGEYEGLETVEVSEFFRFWVHLEYKRRFPRFARNAGAATV